MVFQKKKYILLRQILGDIMKWETILKEEKDFKEYFQSKAEKNIPEIFKRLYGKIEVIENTIFELPMALESGNEVKKLGKEIEADCDALMKKVKKLEKMVGRNPLTSKDR